MRDEDRKNTSRTLGRPSNSSVFVTILKTINLDNTEKKSYYVKITVASKNAKTVAVPTQFVQGSHNKVSFVPWIPDYAVKDCGECQISFTFMNRRHHCRYCGQIFCGKCSANFMLLPMSFGLRNNQRVCNKCAKILEPIQEYLQSAYAEVSKVNSESVYKVYRTTSSDRNSLSTEWNERIDLGVGDPEALLTISLFAEDRLIGSCEIVLEDLCARPVRDLFLQDSSGDLIVKSKAFLPVLLRVSIDSSHYIRNTKMPDLDRIKSKHYRIYPKHLFMITRGTRGDVQPFVALARGLANNHDWKVTIVTELRYKSFIKAHSKVEKGCICFRPSGGDTQRTVDSKIGKWAIKLESDVMNTLMLSRSEAQFFPSEPAIYYWAQKEKPDLLMFGFTMAAVAMNVSEALHIPLLGFLLQPTCVPTKRFPPILPLDQKAYETIRNSSSKHEMFSHLKEMMENNPLSRMLNTMRRRRGLKSMSRREETSSVLVNFLGALGYPTTCKTWRELTNKNVPLIIPINETIFGGKPEEWSENTVFVDNIFLRGSTVPELRSDLRTFITLAKAKKEKIVILAFSSMPVGFAEIMRIAVRIVRECDQRVSVIALTGNNKRSSRISEKHKELEAEFSSLALENRIYVGDGAPFDKLFPTADAIVAHGGLGTTFEAILSKVPVIVTGVLLFDQRFWGVRCSELGVGPYPIHINKFLDKCVETVNTALEPGSSWSKNAKILGERIEASANEDPTGTIRNAEAVVKMAAKAEPYVYRRPPNPITSALSSLSYKSRKSAYDEDNDEFVALIEDETSEDSIVAEESK